LKYFRFLILNKLFHQLFVPFFEIIGVLAFNLNYALILHLFFIFQKLDIFIFMQFQNTLILVCLNQVFIWNFNMIRNFWFILMILNLFLLFLKIKSPNLLIIFFITEFIFYFTQALIIELFLALCFKKIRADLWKFLVILAYVHIKYTQILYY
jgi:hypothetical protein